MHVLHRGKGAFPLKLSGRSGRAVTLLTTVLLSALAATIAVVIVRQALLLSEGNSQDVNTLVVSRTASEVRGEFERELASDNQFYLTRTFAWERPRKCLSPSAGQLQGKWLVPVTGSDGQPVSQPWPQECGHYWEYPDVGSGLEIPDSLGFTTYGGQIASRQWQASQWLTRAEVSLPGPDRPDLELVILSAGGTQEGGTLVSYTRDSVSRWALYSASDLDVTAIAGVDGIGEGASAYALGNITATNPGENFRAGVLASEQSVGLGAGDAGRVAVADPSPEQLTQGFLDVRGVAQEPLSLENLRASFEGNVLAACPDADPFNTLDGLYSSHVCLGSGRMLALADGSTVNVPSGVRSWLIVLSPTSDESGYPKASIYYSTEELEYVRECTVECSLSSMSSNLANNGAYPQTAPGSWGSPWQSLGTVKYPAGGVIWAEADTFVSTVGTPSSSDKSLTIMAGTGYSPADILVGGNLTTSGQALVGLVASGGVRFPYFIAQPGVQAQVQAASTGMGWGSQAPSVSGLPIWQAGPEDTRPSLAVTGSLAGTWLGELPAMASTTLTYNPELSASQPPLYASFTNTWRASQTTVLASVDVCSQWMDENGLNTCYGGW